MPNAIVFSTMSGILDPFTRFTKEQQVAVTKKLHLDDTMRTAALDSEKRKSRCKKNRKTEPVDEDNQEVVNDCRFLDPRSEDGRFTTFVIAEFEEHLLENPVWKAVLGSRRICILQTGFFCSHGLCSLHPEVSVDVVTRAAAKRAKVIGSSYVNSIVTSNELWAAVFLLPAHFIFLRVFLIGWVERDPASGSAGKYLVVMCIYDSLCDDAYKKAKESLVEKLSAYLGNLPSAPWRDEEHLHVVVCKMQQIKQTDSVSCGPLTVSVFLRLLRDVRDAEPDVYNGRFSTFVKASGGSAKTPLSIEQLLKRHSMFHVLLYIYLFGSASCYRCLAIYTLTLLAMCVAYVNISCLCEQI